MKEKFPGFKKCMAMMRSKDGGTQDDGFHCLLHHASEYVPELIDEFRRENDLGLRCWLLELIGWAKSPEAFVFLAEQLRCDESRFRSGAIEGLKVLDMKEARTLLWHARSFTFRTQEEYDEFRKKLDSPPVLKVYEGLTGMN